MTDVGIFQIVPEGGIPPYIPAGTVAEKPTPPPVRPPTPPRDPRTPTPNPTGPTKLPPGPPTPSRPPGHAFLPKLPTPPIPRLKIGRVFATWPWLLRPGDRVVEFDIAHREVDSIERVLKIERPSPGRGCSTSGIHINSKCYSRHIPVFYVPRKEENADESPTTA